MCLFAESWVEAVLFLGSSNDYSRDLLDICFIFCLDTDKINIQYLQMPVSSQDQWSLEFFHVILQDLSSYSLNHYFIPISLESQFNIVLDWDHNFLWVLFSVSVSTKKEPDMVMVLY